MQSSGSKFGAFVPSLLIAGILFFTAPLMAAEPPQPVLAPLNSAFLDFTRNRSGVSRVTSEGHSLGRIPSPIDRRYLKKGGKSAARSATAIPSSYDLRKLGRLTAVRDQGYCGSCWAFGTLASLESSLMPSEKRDFSENNLINISGFDLGPCDGGFEDMTVAYLMRWSGPVNEKDDPYNGQEVPNPSPTGLTVQKHSQNIFMLPSRSSSTDNDAIKRAVMENGALSAGMYYDDPYYSSANHAYYTNLYSPDPYSDSNHEVAIVGWDDNYDKSKFSPTPPGNGAFIVRNSWGTSWGEKGYFYISYYDTFVGYSGLYSFTTPEKSGNYSTIYSYDPLGLTNAFGFGSNTGWFANVFTAGNSDPVSAVSLYSAQTDAPYEIYVYRGLTDAANPRSGTLAATESGTFSDAGYLTVPLTTPVTVSSGDVFSVVVKLTTPGYNYPVPVEYAVSGYSSQASASAGQSFVSSDGAGWSDAVNSIASTANVCVKAYAKPLVTGSIVINNDDAYTTKRAVTLSFSSSDGVGYMRLSNDGTKWGNWLKYAASKKYTLPAGDGLKTVYAQFKDGQDYESRVYSDSITLDTVKPVDGALQLTPLAGNLIRADWSGFTDATSGLKEYRLMAGPLASLAYCTGTPAYTGTETTFTADSLKAGTVYFFRVCEVDNAGKVSKGATAKSMAVAEMDPPTGTISINNGDASTAKRKVTLSMKDISDASGIATMCISNTSACKAWTFFGPTKSWTLTAGNGQKTVYAWFRDIYGNTSQSPVTATIVLNVPGAGSTD